MREGRVWGSKALDSDHAHRRRTRTRLTGQLIFGAVIKGASGRHVGKLQQHEAAGRPVAFEHFDRAATDADLGAMRGLPGLVTMRSITKYGLSVVTLVFRDNVDIYFARQLVFERLGSVSDKLPEGVKAELGPITTAMGEIYQYTIEGKPPADPSVPARPVATRNSGSG